MNKTITRLILLVLAIALTVPCFSCASQTDGDPDATGEISGAGDSSAVEEDTDASKPPMEQKNYDCDYTTLYCRDSFYDIDYYFADEESGIGVADQAYERSLYIEDYLGVTLKVDDGGTWLDYFPKLKNSITAGDDRYSLVMTHPHGSIANMISSGYALDFTAIPGIDIDNAYWNKDLMEEIAVGDSMYLGYGDLMLASCYLITFNKQMYENHGYDNPYLMVDNKEWTLDKFLSLASDISIDVTGNGKSPEDDTFSLTGWGWVPVVSFMSACNIKVADKDSDGEVYISLDKDYGEKFAGLVDVFKDVFRAPSTYFYPVGAEPIYPEIDSGRTLFSLLYNKSLISYTESQVRIGVLPYPLYDSNQDGYKTLSWNGYMVIPSSVRNQEMVGNTTELLMFLSDPVKTAYFEVLLGARIANAQDDARMLDILWKTQVSDIGLTYCSTSNALETLFYALPRLGNSNDQYASFFKSYGKPSERKLKNLFNN